MATKKNAKDEIPNVTAKDEIPKDAPPQNSSTDKNKYKHKKNTWHWLQLSLVCILKLIVSLMAASLAWGCNSSQNIILRFIIAIIALIFSEFYIIYYAIYRVFMGNNCL
mgnify:CR=1 FL=1